MLAYTEPDASSASEDEVYRECLRCGKMCLCYYWDDELEAYIYLTKEDEFFCNRCTYGNFSPIQ